MTHEHVYLQCVTRQWTTCPCHV